MQQSNGFGEIGKYTTGGFHLLRSLEFVDVVEAYAWCTIYLQLLIPAVECGQFLLQVGFSIIFPAPELY